MEQLYSGNETAAVRHRNKAASIREGVLDLFWNSTKASTLVTVIIFEEIDNS